jgi:5-formyltetrahydrofolate cyclo-ligase
MPEYKAARRISVYLSMPTGEINTSNIVRDALDQGKKVFIPYTYNSDNPINGQPKSIMDMMELSSMKDFESLEADKWGIPTPSKDSISLRANSFGTMGVTNGKSDQITDGLDLIVMPGMAFDHSFGRLGHGKGFYDFFLSRCHQAARMPLRGKNYWYSIAADGLTNHVKVGLSLTEQLLPPNESVPMDQSDFRLDALITGDGELRRA